MRIIDINGHMINEPKYYREAIEAVTKMIDEMEAEDVDRADISAMISHFNSEIRFHLMFLPDKSLDHKPTKYTHVYWARKGLKIEDWTVDRNGYVWYDEAGLLGTTKTYSTAEEANEALGKYAREFL